MLILFLFVFAVSPLVVEGISESSFLVRAKDHLDVDDGVVGGRKRNGGTSAVREPGQYHVMLFLSRGTALHDVVHAAERT